MKMREALDTWVDITSNLQIVDQLLMRILMITTKSLTFRPSETERIENLRIRAELSIDGMESGGKLRSTHKMEQEVDKEEE